MGARVHRSGCAAMRLRLWATAAALLLASLDGAAHARQAAAPPAETAAGAGQRVALDRVVVVVNGDLILQSDVEAEQRFAAFQPFRDQSAVTQEQLVERLIDRDLILQQLHLQPEPPIPDAEVDAQLATLRKSIPECAAYHCETDAGWEKFAAAQGFTLAEVRDRWRLRMEVLRFIEQRFRMGIRISQEDIDGYYHETLVPGYRKQNTTPPAEAAVSDRIQEILLQQQVTALMNDWLKTLRAQGSVRIVKAGEAMP